MSTKKPGITPAQIAVVAVTETHCLSETVLRHCFARKAAQVRAAFTSRPVTLTPLSTSSASAME